MLIDRIGLTQWYVDGFIQTKGYLVGNAISIAGIVATVKRNIQIWKHTMNVHTGLDAISIRSENSNNRHLVIELHKHKQLIYITNASSIARKILAINCGDLPVLFQLHEIQSSMDPVPVSDIAYNYPPIQCESTKYYRCPLPNTVLFGTPFGHCFCYYFSAHLVDFLVDNRNPDSVFFCCYLLHFFNWSTLFIIFYLHCYLHFGIQYWLLLWIRLKSNKKFAQIRLLKKKLLYEELTLMCEKKCRALATLCHWEHRISQFAACWFFADGIFFFWWDAGSVKC